MFQMLSVEIFTQDAKHLGQFVIDNKHYMLSDESFLQTFILIEGYILYF